LKKYSPNPLSKGKRELRRYFFKLTVIERENRFLFIKKWIPTEGDGGRRALSWLSRKKGGKGSIVTPPRLPPRCYMRVPVPPSTTSASENERGKRQGIAYLVHHISLGS